MVKKQIINNFGLVAIIVVIALAFLPAVMFMSAANGNQNNANAVGVKGDSVETADKPMIIWYQTVGRDPNILHLVLKNGIFTHVMLRGVHQLDNPYYHLKPNVKGVIDICKQKGVKVIWTRALYPQLKFSKWKNEYAFDTSYYALRIRQVRKESRLIGADFVAFDAEPPREGPMLSLKKRKLARDKFEIMKNAVKTAVEIEGQVDFVLPAGKDYPNHLYNATRQLGKYVVAEYTYYDRPLRISLTKIPYDIFGVFVSIREENKDHPHLPFFTPREILQRQDLWAHKKGLFIYPGRRKNAAEVALEFSKITSVRPVRDSNDI